MRAKVMGALKAVVAGVFAGGAALAVVLGADPELTAAIFVVLTPLMVYLAPNSKSLKG